MTYIELRMLVVMWLRSSIVGVALLCLVGCTSDDGSETESTTAPSGSFSTTDTSSHQGSLTEHERSLATSIAKRQQSRVTGTFIGATSFVTHGTPFDPGSGCDVDKAMLDIRLVWKADANFDHGGVPGGTPDGPRKDLLIVVDPTTGHVCETVAGYRGVGAAAGETLLYGVWPGKTDA